MSPHPILPGRGAAEVVEEVVQDGDVGVRLLPGGLSGHQRHDVFAIRLGVEAPVKCRYPEVLQLRIWYGDSMRSCRPPLFRKRKFDPDVIVTCVRWYLRFSLSLRDLEELMAERGLAVDHTSIWRSGGGFRPTA